jgi:hypothetical protein
VTRQASKESSILSVFPVDLSVLVRGVVSSILTDAPESPMKSGLVKVLPGKGAPLPGHQSRRPPKMNLSMNDRGGWGDGGS